MLASTCSIRLPTSATVKFLSRLFTALNLLPSVATAARVKKLEPTAKLDERSAHRPDRLAIVLAEIGNRFEVGREPLDHFGAKHI